MNTSAAARPIDFNQSTFWFAGLLGVALVAFWPSYLSPASATVSAYTHVHAATATVWMVLLIVQPWLIRTRRLAIHRMIGRTSYAIAPAVIVSMLLLAHSRLQGLTSEQYLIQEYVLYLQLSLAVVFALCYALAIHHRRRKELHARFMIGTALTLVDPVLIRLMFWIAPQPSFNYQWVTFGVTDLVLVGLIAYEWRRSAPHWVFRTMLGVFVLAQVPALFGLTTSAAWKAVVRWYAALPLT
jgi:uncharacterized membrane protein